MNLYFTKSWNNDNFNTSTMFLCVCIVLVFSIEVQCQPAEERISVPDEPYIKNHKITTGKFIRSYLFIFQIFISIKIIFKKINKKNLERKQ